MTNFNTNAAIPGADKFRPLPNPGRLPGLRPQPGSCHRPGMPGDALQLGNGPDHGSFQLKPGQNPVDAVRQAVGDPNADVREMPKGLQHGKVQLKPGQTPEEAIREAIGDPNADVRPLPDFGKAFSGAIKKFLGDHNMLPTAERQPIPQADRRLR